jgi:uncharacterized protein YndB with AHSA1/START domain
MPEVTESIFIARSPEDVHTFLMTTENVTLWQTNLIEYALLDDELRKGSTFRGVSKVAGRKVPFVMEVAELEVGKHSLMRTTEAPMQFSLEYTFTPQEGGTLFTYHLDAAPFGGFFGKLADPLVTRMFSKDVRSNLEQLKELLEA